MSDLKKVLNVMTRLQKLENKNTCRYKKKINFMNKKMKIKNVLSSKIKIGLIQK